jgi:CDP-diacylglycerol---glycerol-3-phosphate 3-phosphatidyltransferase
MTDAQFRWRVLIPLTLTSSRVALAVIVLIVADGSRSGTAFVACLTLAVLTDIFDGVLARRLGVSSTRLRRYDSAADVAFYLAVLWATCIVHPEIVADFRLGLGALLVLEITCQTVSVIRSGRPPATHAYSAKAWGLCLFAAFVAILGFGTATGWLDVAIAIGCVADLDVIAIMLLAPRGAVDVPTVVHALRLRRKLAAASARDSTTSTVT